jgi:putative Holliday junction resolvase
MDGRMRVLGLDVGERRVGVAISDALGLTAQPLAVLERLGTERDAEAIRAVVERHQVEEVVVGLPLTMRGEQGIQAKKVLAFAQLLRGHLSVPVQFVDERLTTVQSERTLREMETPRRKRRQIIDRVAAQLILQHFLDARRSQSRRDEP